MRYDRPRPLTAALQFANLRNNPICAGTGALRAGRLVWRYNASPTALSRAYQLRIDYRQDDVPQVFVEDPDLLSLAGGRRLPHVYMQKPTCLCLYTPSAREWSGWMRIDQTIVPWVALWLFYFEQWLDSDDWKGGGQHPRTAPRRQRR
jgi:hypothetical protein